MMVDCSNLPGGSVWDFCDSDIFLNLTSPFAALDRVFKDATLSECRSSNDDADIHGFNAEGEDEELTAGVIIMLSIIMLVILIKITPDFIRSLRLKFKEMDAKEIQN